ncbi:MAG TPA: SMP-30/gluconolactonase/LRE family protein [Acidimicrobiales bacterium]|nr:SMP-30/gluconolactonase/LRE family protein [Acidimicrobiales bacterium]
MGEPLEYEVVTTGLHFPEGPIAMPDGSVVLVEIERGRLSRVRTDGTVEVVAETGGGPNGAAVGPDGAFWVCNNGGFFTWHQVSEDLLLPGETPDTWQGGSLQRVRADGGAVEEIVTECGGKRLRAPNDLVFDSDGGLWFTDHGVTADRSHDQAGVLYRSPTGEVLPVVYGVESTNGIGLSPEGDRLYVAETHTGRVWAWSVVGAGQVATDPASDAPHGGTLLYDAPEGHLFDSLAVDGDGWVCVATLGQGGITCLSPDGAVAEHLPLPDPIVTNICFGGDDGRTAFITSSGRGELLATRWSRPGLRLAF